VIKAHRQRLGDHLCFVFRNFPLRRIRAQAQNAAEAAEAAAAQNRFWEMHDTLFANQQALENGNLVEYADKLKLDTSRFLRDMSSHFYADQVEEDVRSGLQSGVIGTPSVFINGVRHDDVLNIESLLAAVDAAVTYQKDATERP